MPNKFPQPNPLDEDDADSQFFVASSTDCTGLIPSAPSTENEVDSYNELYDIPLDKNTKDANHHIQDIHNEKTPTLNTKADPNRT